MDNKTLFIRTSKGEDEARSKTSHLAGDIKRALAMVDGTATFGEISKRAAPSLRSVLDEMFNELEKGGFIQDKAKASNIPRMVVPPKLVVPAKKPVEDVDEELDFTAAFRPPSREAMAAEAAKVKAEADTKAKQEAEAAKLKKAQQEAEAARLKAEREAAKAREEAEQRARKEAEAARIKAEQEAAKAKAEAEARAREEAERRAREEAEAARLKAQQEAEAARIKAEQEAAKAKEEAERRAREEAEQRAREEAEAARIKAEQEAAKAKAEAEARAKEEAERRAREEAEAARLKAQQEEEAARIKAEQEAAKAKAEAEAKAREEAERRAREEAEAKKADEEVRLKAEQEAAKAREEAERRAREEAELAGKAAAEAKAREEAELHAKEEAALAEAAKRKPAAVQTSRSTSATVLFFDIVGYTKQPVNKQIQVKKQFNQLLSDSLGTLEDGDHIILDTGDGAAIGFLQHPEDALEVAMQFRKRMMANGHKDYPDLKVRTGIHLGPINVVQDMNGQNNMVGDGINDAQRVMSFAGTDQIYISRPYHDFVSRLSEEYADLFQYRGSQQDKHGREHTVYEVVDALTPVAEVTLPQTGEPELAIKLEPFSFATPEAAAPSVSTVPDEEQQQDQDVAAQLMSDIGQLNQPEEAGEPADAGQAAQQQPPSPAATTEKLPEKPPEEVTKEAAKPVAEARMPSEEDVRKLAETQAKAWTEAEQRAAAAASAKHAAQPQEVPQIAKDKRAVRAPRKPIPWGKVGAGLFVLLLVALFAVPYILPMKDYATGIERLLTANLQQPVRIGQLAGRLLPAPRLELKDVSIGETKSIQVQRAQVDFALSALFSSSKPIDNLELDGMQVNGTDLTQVSAWLQKIAADTQYPIAHVKLSQARLETDGMQLSGIEGEIGFNQTGRFTQAKLKAEGGKFAMGINAVENRMQVSIEVRASALPLLPGWVFDDLSAKGELTNDELAITDLDGRIMGGILLGDARIAWRSGWQAQGKLVAKTITIQNMGKALSGDMDGTASFRMQAASLSGLAESAALDGTFAVKKGTINGVDIVETARLRSRENLPGGRTHFDELSGNLSVADGVYAFRQLKLDAGVLTATGSLDIANQELSGRILADLSMRAGMGSVALQIGGATDNPTLRAVP